MTSLPIRDPIADHLITPQNSTLVLIDYQPTQFSSVRSMDPALLLKNIVSTVKTAKLFALPIVHSTVNVSSGQNKSTVPELAELLEDSPPIDRTTINSWEDADFVAAVHATGRRKLVFCALWTEACMAFAALDALTERFSAIGRASRPFRSSFRSCSPNACRRSDLESNPPLPLADRGARQFARRRAADGSSSRRDSGRARELRRLLPTAA
jgi:hypothetical protein